MRYFFHTRSEDGDEHDLEGVELPHYKPLSPKPGSLRAR